MRGSHHPSAPRWVLCSVASAKSLESNMPSLFWGGYLEESQVFAFGNPKHWCLDEKTVILAVKKNTAFSASGFRSRSLIKCQTPHFVNFYCDSFRCKNVFNHSSVIKHQFQIISRGLSEPWTFILFPPLIHSIHVLMWGRLTTFSQMDGEDDVGLKDRPNATRFGGSFFLVSSQGSTGDPRAPICPEVSCLHWSG